MANDTSTESQPDTWSNWQVTKLDAARRQLDTAIWVLFEQRDAVSVHTLAHAAFGVLKGIANHRTSSKVLTMSATMAASGSKGAFWNSFNRTGNFFKHGCSPCRAPGN